MMPSSAVFVGGVGIAHAKHPVSTVHDLVVSAGTKALLDAGLTYSDVKQTVACFLDDELRVPKASFDRFGRTGTPVCEVDSYSGFYTTKQFVKSGHADCAMMVGFDKDQSHQAQSNGQVAAIAIILVSESFKTSHAYLRDSSALIRGCRVAGPIHSRSSNEDDATITTKTAIQAALKQAVLSADDIQIMELRHGSNHGAQAALGELNVSKDGSASPVSHPFVGTTGLAGFCELVWQLRGWARERSVPNTHNCLQYTLSPDGTAFATVLCRADGQPAPSWDSVKNVRDGRERLGYNPATETREITIEDWEAVKARDNFVPEHVPKSLKFGVKGGDRAALARL